MKHPRITPEFFYIHRRNFIQHGFTLGMLSLMPEILWGAQKYPAKQNPLFKTPKGVNLTTENLATGYNNFYEFSLDKEEVQTKVKDWKLDPNWKVEISGLVDQKKSFHIDELIEMAGGLEERVYRFRCVEGWSMVVPWTGFSLAKLLEKVKPQTKAKFVQFQSFADKSIAKNIANLPTYPWPYTEGLTMPEAMHPLTFIATGMYGKPIPKQNGAPIRLVVPWKYGFKSIKSIVKIEMTEAQPKTLWQQLAPSEYGFYANVNPQVDHPRWSQATERILDGSFFPKRQPTLMFNGYEKEVASLYKGLDLNQNY